MSKYRFKTKEEFIRDGLWDEKHNCPEFWAFNGDMNMYLGEDVPNKFNGDCDKNKSIYHDLWSFRNTDYVLKEQEQQYYNNLSLHIGRYIQALIDAPHAGGVKKGEYGLITSKDYADFPSQKRYSCTNALSQGNLNIKYKLMPEGFIPPKDMKETKDFPKYWFVKNNKQPELLDYAGHISKESPKWWETYAYIGYDGVKSLNGIHGCSKSSFINDAVEVSFEDFLENIYYVKFPKKRKQKSEFVLPEKWYTKPKTNEEKDVLNKFVVDLKDNHWKIEDKYSYEHTPHFKNGNYQRSTWIGYEDNDYTEITFEQFKKYVLKDKSVASTDKVKYVIATSEEAVFVSSVVESVSISILNVEDSKILPLPKSIESIKTKLN